MAVFKSFTFDGENSLNYGVYIRGEAVYDAPMRSVDMITIPGKNGALALDNGRFENIEVRYPAGVFGDDQTEFATKIRTFRNVLVSRFNYVRLTDEYNTEEFRLGLYKSGLLVSPVQINRAGEFEIVFDCKPQRFLTSGETITTFTTNGTITNPTQFESKPIITITGTGTVTVNGIAITVTATPTTIDCETMEAYNGTTSRNGTTTLSPNRFPVLSPGSNAITKTSGITKIQITPRWYIL